MSVTVALYSSNSKDIHDFLNKFYDTNSSNINTTEWEKDFANPIEIADIIGVFIDNNNKYNINMWINLDSGFFLNVTDNNANKIIKYLYERYPY